MEKTSLCRNMKQKSLLISNRAANLNDMLSYKADQGDLLGAGYPWPPRSYSCTFCKREFRSAQALGGHMNVHRRDRARLNQITSPVKEFNLNATDEPFPLLNLNVDPPNPSFFTNPSNPSPFQASALSTFYPAKSSTRGSNLYPKTDFLRMKAGDGHFGVGKLENESCDNVVISKKAEFVKLELEIGLITPLNYKEELDLELRLGYTT